MWRMVCWFHRHVMQQVLSTVTNVSFSATMDSPYKVEKQLRAKRMEIMITILKNRNVSQVSHIYIITLQ